MEASMPRIDAEESERIQERVLLWHSHLTGSLPKAIEWFIQIRVCSDDGSSTSWDSVIGRMWEMAKSGQLGHDNGCSRMFYMGLLLASVADEKKRSPFEMANHLRRVLRERGGDYGSLVLVELGFEYTLTGIKAKLLRIINKMQQDGTLLFDECLDIAGYAVLHFTVMQLLQEV